MDTQKTVLINNEAVPVSETKTKTVISFSKPTPQWAKVAFRITFIITTAAVGYIAATNAIPQETKYEVTLILKLLVDPIVFGISKMFGIEVKDVG